MRRSTSLARTMLLAVAVTLSVGTAGCARGLLYRHTIEPFDLNLTGEAVQTERATGDKGSVMHLAIPYSLTGRVHFLWSSNAIGDIARKHGFEKVHYADLEQFNVLGIWRQYTIHIYGTRGDSAPQSP